MKRATATEPEFLEAHKQLIESAYILHINGRHRKLMRSAMAVAKEVGTYISLDGGAQRYDERYEAYYRSQSHRYRSSRLC